MDISVIIPLYNEEESLPELFAWIEKVMKENHYTYEIIAVNDGSRDNSWDVIKRESERNPHIKGISFQRNYGKSPALNVGFDAAQGDVVITMDADLQDSPDEIPGLYKMIKEEGYHLVSGWKQKRLDPVFSKNIPSKFFNGVTRKVSGIQLNDFNCGLKAYQKKVIKSIEVYGEMHRYIPVIAKWAGFEKIGEKAVKHQERKYGVTKFGWNRFVNGFLDLMSIVFITKFARRPMHLFGLWGTGSFLIGFMILLYLSISKIFFSQLGIASRPIFYFGILAIIIGAQMFLTGFLAELVSRSAPERNDYKIGERVGW
ncbi:MAG: glycosyltransferase [Chitinophagales bacterium]|nr:glycosyltransferase [Chitinophagales bacterium]